MWRILEIRVSERGESCCGFWLKLGLQSCYSWCYWRGFGYYHVVFATGQMDLHGNLESSSLFPFPLHNRRSVTSCRVMPKDTLIMYCMSSTTFTLTTKAEANTSKKLASLVTPAVAGACQSTTSSWFCRTCGTLQGLGFQDFSGQELAVPSVGWTPLHATAGACLSPLWGRLDALKTEGE